MTTSEEQTIAKRLDEDTGAKVMLQSLLREYDYAQRELTKADATDVPWKNEVVSRFEGQMDALRIMIAIFTGVYCGPWPMMIGGVTAWLPALRRIAR